MVLIIIVLHSHKELANGQWYDILLVIITANILIRNGEGMKDGKEELVQGQEEGKGEDKGNKEVEKNKTKKKIKRERI